MKFPLRLYLMEIVPATVGNERAHSSKTAASGRTEKRFQPGSKGVTPSIRAGMTASGPPLQAWFTLPQFQSPSTPTFQFSNRVS